MVLKNDHAVLPTLYDILNSRKSTLLDILSTIMVIRKYPLSVLCKFMVRFIETILHRLSSSSN